MTRATSRSVLFGLVLTVIATAPVSAGVLGQVALNDARIDGALAPTGTTVMSPSLVETGNYPSTVHLSSGRTVSLGPNSSAYLKAGSEGGIELAARRGDVRVGDPSGETFQIASNTVAFLDDEEPAAGDPMAKIKMCEEPGKPVMVPLDEAEVQAKIDLGWGVAGVDPYDEDCKKKKGAVLFFWTPAKVAAVVGGVSVLGIIVNEELKDTEVQCQAAEASPFLPGVPICGI